jgi:unsaturated rhamnogalacturonyl hydrolase
MKRTPGVPSSPAMDGERATEKADQPGVSDRAWSMRMADSIMKRHPLLSRRWHYEPGVALLAIKQVWLKTGEQRYLNFIQRNLDEFVRPDGAIRTYRLEEYNLDQINEGKLLFLLYDETGAERYKRAAYLLRQQLRTQPRTKEGGFWHKQIYPHQMWLDGIYMASPFYAEFAKAFNEPEGFDDVAQQILLIARHTRDPQTGLLYHGWDESKEQKWADPETGCSPNFWGRAIGWYVMAIPDVLDHLPEHYPEREKIIEIFATTMSALATVQDPSTGVWYQVLDQGDRAGKGVRKGYIDKRFLEVAKRGYAGILAQFIDAQEPVSLKGICSVGGLGGKPYRDGSFDYYIGEKIISDDYKGLGPFIMASVEIEKQTQAA